METLPHLGAIYLRAERELQAERSNRRDFLLRLYEAGMFFIPVGLGGIPLVQGVILEYPGTIFPI